MAAQENTTNATTTVPPTSSGELSLSDATTITDWRFENGTVHVTMELEISRTVTITDGMAGANTTGATRPPKQSWDLSRGTHNLTMPVEQVRGGSSVTVASAGGSYRLSNAMEPPEDDDANPFETFGGESGLFTGVLMTTGLAGIGAWWVVRSEENGVIEA
ncbi:hypothetical protein [Halostella litorea]|uniref:hypothetical protein n=1 Tax=Halostella litorea TaxID=2528831 RepID=UPI00109269DD|nr:hypothetical protein [Halostella litorea]